MSAVLNSSNVERNRSTDQKVAYLKRLANICGIKTTKNLIRDLPQLEKTLCGMTMDLYAAIQHLSGLDPRRFGAKKKYEELCASTQLACAFFRSFQREKPYQGYTISSQDVEDALVAWINELNVFSHVDKPGSRPVWLAMQGKKLKLVKVVEKSDSRFQAVDGFTIDTEVA